MMWRHTRSTRTDTLFPYTTLFRSVREPPHPSRRPRSEAGPGHGRRPGRSGVKTSTRVRIALVGVLCTLTATSLVGHGDRSAQAQDAPVARELGGYQGRASASGMHLFYTPEGLLPVPSLIDIGAPNSLATIASGPSTFARASTADPGDLLANPDALLALVSSEYPQGLIPAYPYRASATSGFGAPIKESNPRSAEHTSELQSIMRNTSAVFCL